MTVVHGSVESSIEHRSLAKLQSKVAISTDIRRKRSCGAPYALAPASPSLIRSATVAQRRLPIGQLCIVRYAGIPLGSTAGAATAHPAAPLAESRSDCRCGGGPQAPGAAGRRQRGTRPPSHSPPRPTSPRPCLVHPPIAAAGLHAGWAPHPPLTSGAWWRGLASPPPPATSRRRGTVWRRVGSGSVAWARRGHRGRGRGTLRRAAPFKATRQDVGCDPTGLPPYPP